MGRNNFNEDDFVKAASAFREHLELEATIAAQVHRALAAVGEAAIKLVALCRENGTGKGPVITAKISETVVQISGGGRNVAFAAARGLASDHRLARPRGESCGQILVFAHLSGQAETTLLSSFRIYSNGDCTDGEIGWTIDDGVDAFLTHLADIVRCAIFESSVYWPHQDLLPGYVQKVPILEEELQEESLKKSCVGFECNLRR